VSVAGQLGAFHGRRNHYFPQPRAVYEAGIELLNPREGAICG